MAFWIILPVTSDIEAASIRADTIICEHCTHEQTRVFSLESGHKNSDSSFSEGVFVTDFNSASHSRYKLKLVELTNMQITPNMTWGITPTLWQVYGYNLDTMTSDNIIVFADCWKKGQLWYPSYNLVTFSPDTIISVWPLHQWYQHLDRRKKKKKISVKNVAYNQQKTLEWELVVKLILQLKSRGLRLSRICIQWKSWHTYWELKVIFFDKNGGKMINWNMMPNK